MSPVQLADVLSIPAAEQSWGQERLNILHEKEEALPMGKLTLAALLCMSVIAGRLLLMVSTPHTSP